MAQESKLQTKIRKYLEADGWEVVKTIVMSKAGYEDLFCFRDGKTMFIEVKSEKKQPDPLQDFRIKQHQENGFVSFFANSWEMFIEKFTESK
jgi:Holliday junction resolvase